MAAKKTETKTTPKCDLDGDEKLRDYGDQTPFYPFGESETVSQLVAFNYHDGYKGKAYRAKVKIVENGGREDMREGKLYVLHFSLDGNAEQQRAKKKELRQFVAAMFSADARDEGFKANEAMTTLCELTDSEEIEAAEMKLRISSRDKQGKDKKTDEPLFKKDGSPLMFTNRYYDAFEATDAEKKD